MLQRRFLQQGRREGREREWGGSERESAMGFQEKEEAGAVPRAAVPREEKRRGGWR
jgi:hypothetical protein